LVWDVPAYGRVFRRLASFGRLILFEARGLGLSDPLGISVQLSLEGQAKDMLAVLDAAGAERTAVVANSTSGLLAIFFAASYPNRTSALVLGGCYTIPETGLAPGSAAEIRSRPPLVTRVGFGARADVSLPAP
jgi:pimeloyl-ACP methyl ester carboxylesterase